MTAINYTVHKGSLDFIPEEQFNRCLELVEENMNLGGSVISAGGVHCDFHYGCLGLVELMSEVEWEPPRRGEKRAPTYMCLFAPDKPKLQALTKSLEVPYIEERVDVE